MVDTLLMVIEWLVGLDILLTILGITLGYVLYQRRRDEKWYESELQVQRNVRNTDRTMVVELRRALDNADNEVKLLQSKVALLENSIRKNGSGK